MAGCVSGCGCVWMCVCVGGLWVWECVCFFVRVSEPHLLFQHRYRPTSFPIDFHGDHWEQDAQHNVEH